MRQAEELLQGTKLELAGVVEVHGAPRAEHYTQAAELATALSKGWE